MIAGLLLAGVIGAVALTDDRRRRHEQILRDAIRLSGVTVLGAAQEAEVDQAQFTRQLEMKEGSHKRLAMQPDAFWSWYAILLFQAFGPPAELRQATRLRRMARMSLPATTKAQAS